MAYNRFLLLNLAQDVFPKRMAHWLFLTYRRANIWSIFERFFGLH